MTPEVSSAAAATESNTVANTASTPNTALLFPGKRVRVTWGKEGLEPESAEGTVRSAQGRRSGKLLTDAGDVVMFPLDTLLSVEELNS